MAKLYRRLSIDLHEIRLLVIESGADNDPVRCRLRHINLRTEPVPPYETVSYVWGNPKVRATIYIHGEPTEVPASTERALRRFRRRHSQRIIWLDAVCINQEDRTERGEQVGVMHAIYGTGYRNLVWLGEDDGTTEESLLMIDLLMKEISEQTRDLENFFEMLYHKNGEEKYSNQGFSSDIDWEPLKAFFSSKWFTRLWIVQEASLARYSMCYRGDFEVPLENVLLVAQWLRYKRSHLPFDLSSQPGMYKASFIANFMQKHYGFAYNAENYATARTSEFAFLLGWLRPFMATEPKDYVYALLGLFMKVTNSEMPPTLRPDYNSPLSATYTSAARFAIADRRDLELLRYVFHRPYEESDEHEKMPSWVPRWNWQWEAEYDSHDLGMSFKACGDEEVFDIEIEVDEPETLVVKGISLGTAQEVSTIIDRKVLASVDQLLGCIGLADYTVRHSPTTKPTARLQWSFGVTETAESIVSAGATILAMTLTAGRDWNRQAFSPPSEAAQGFAAFISYLTDNRTFPPAISTLPETAPKQEVLASRYHQALLIGIENKHIFRTSSGLVGCGPPTMKEGDVVVVLVGLQTLAILRPHTSVEQQTWYEYVGDGYVHGVMFGEAMRLHREANGEDEIFILK